LSLYDPIARLYDPWSRSVTEDVGFYVEEARTAGGPVVELGVGTGRIAVPTAVEGIRVTDEMREVAEQKLAHLAHIDVALVAATPGGPG